MNSLSSTQREKKEKKREIYTLFKLSECWAEKFSSLVAQIAFLLDIQTYMASISSFKSSINQSTSITPSSASFSNFLSSKNST